MSYHNFLQCLLISYELISGWLEGEIGFGLLVTGWLEEKLGAGLD